MFSGEEEPVDQSNCEEDLTSVDPLNLALRAKSNLARVFWWSITVIDFLVLFYFMTCLILKYEDHRINAKIHLKQNQVPFPAVTFCNINPYKRSSLEKIPDLENFVNQFQQLSNSSKSNNSSNKRKKRTAANSCDCAGNSIAEATWNDSSKVRHIYKLTNNRRGVTHTCAWKCCAQHTPNTSYSCRLAKINTPNLIDLLRRNQIITSTEAWIGMFAPFKIVNKPSYKWYNSPNAGIGNDVTVRDIKTFCHSCKTDWQNWVNGGPVSIRILNNAILFNNRVLVSTMPAQICEYLYPADPNIYCDLPPTIPTTSTSSIQTKAPTAQKPTSKITFKATALTAPATSKFSTGTTASTKNTLTPFSSITTFSTRRPAAPTNVTSTSSTSAPTTATSSVTIRTTSFPTPTTLTSSSTIPATSTSSMVVRTTTPTATIALSTTSAMQASTKHQSITKIKTNDTSASTQSSTDRLIKSSSEIMATKHTTFESTLRQLLVNKTSTPRDERMTTAMSKATPRATLLSTTSIATITMSLTPVLSTNTISSQQTSTPATPITSTSTPKSRTTVSPTTAFTTTPTMSMSLLTTIPTIPTTSTLLSSVSTSVSSTRLATSITIQTSSKTGAAFPTAATAETKTKLTGSTLIQSSTNRLADINSEKITKKHNTLETSPNTTDAVSETKQSATSIISTRSVATAETTSLANAATPTVVSAIMGTSSSTPTSSLTSPQDQVALTSKKGEILSLSSRAQSLEHQPSEIHPNVDTVSTTVPLPTTIDTSTSTTSNAVSATPRTFSSTTVGTTVLQSRTNSNTMQTFSKTGARNPTAATEIKATGTASASIQNNIDRLTQISLEKATTKQTTLETTPQILLQPDKTTVAIFATATRPILISTASVEAGTTSTAPELSTTTSPLVLVPTSTSTMTALPSDKIASTAATPTMSLSSTLIGSKMSLTQTISASTTQTSTEAGATTSIQTKQTTTAPTGSSSDQLQNTRSETITTKPNTPETILRSTVITSERPIATAETASLGNMGTPLVVSTIATPTMSLSSATVNSIIMSLTKTISGSTMQKSTEAGATILTEATTSIQTKRTTAAQTQTSIDQLVNILLEKITTKHNTPNTLAATVTTPRATLALISTRPAVTAETASLINNAAHAFITTSSSTSTLNLTSPQVDPVLTAKSEKLSGFAIAKPQNQQFANDLNTNTVNTTPRTTPVTSTPPTSIAAPATEAMSLSSTTIITNTASSKTTFSTFQTSATASARSLTEATAEIETKEAASIQSNTNQLTNTHSEKMRTTKATPATTLRELLLIEKDTPRDYSTTVVSEITTKATRRRTTTPVLAGITPLESVLPHGATSPLSIPASASILTLSQSDQVTTTSREGDAQKHELTEQTLTTILIQHALNKAKTDFNSLSATSQDMLPYLLATLPPSVLIEAGYNATEVIMHCVYNGARCSVSDFELKLDPNYGNCYTFNANGSFGVGARAGALTGLSVRLAK